MIWKRKEGWSRIFPTATRCGTLDSTKIAFGFDRYGFRRLVRFDFCRTDRRGFRRLAGAIFPLTSAEVFTILRQTKRNRQGRRGVRSQTPSERAVRRLRDSFGTREWKVALEPER